VGCAAGILSTLQALDPVAMYRGILNELDLLKAGLLKVRHKLPNNGNSPLT
jgi:hypothetical protein